MSKKNRKVGNKFVLKVALMSAPQFEGEFGNIFSNRRKSVKYKSSQVMKNDAELVPRVGCSQCSTDPPSSSSRKAVSFTLCH